MSGLIVMSNNSTRPAGHEPSKIWPSAPASLQATRQNDTKGLMNKPQKPIPYTSRGTISLMHFDRLSKEIPLSQPQAEQSQLQIR